MAVQINGDTGNVSATKADFSGNISIGGTLTYEDVTNVDSVGLITARTGIEVGARPGVAASISVDGNAIFSGITTIGGASKFGGNMQMTSGNPEFEFNNGGPRLRVPAANTLSIFTTGGFGTTTNERIRITSSGQVLVGSNSLNADIAASVGSHLQIEGTTYQTSSLALINNQASTDPAFLVFGKSRAGSNGGVTVVQSDDRLGGIRFAGADGTDLHSYAAEIGAVVGGTPGSNDMPGRLVFSTTPDGSNSPSERLRISPSGNFALGSAVDAGNTLRYLDVANYNTGSSAGSIMRLLTTKSDGSSTAGFDIIKYKSGTAGFLNYENVGTVGDITFSTSPTGGTPLECMRLFYNGYHKFNRLPMFISNVTSTLGTSGSLTASPAAGKAQLTAAADNNNNFDSTNKNFVCPVNGYYNVVIDFAMGDMAESRRIVVFGYTLGGATGQQSNYVEPIDMIMDDHTNQNYSHPWYFTAGTTIAVGMGGQSGDISPQNVQLSVFLITAI